MEKSINMSRNDTGRFARYAETVLQEDASGWQTFSYGKLGEVTENICTFAPPFENQTYTFSMYFEYDSWNRIQNITYPDGEKVSYDYNRGGMLESVIGDKNGGTYKYIGEIRYNPFEQKESVHYGNGTVTDYSYDVLLRLSHLHSVCTDGVMQDIDYDYDEVSNINSIENLAGVLPNNLGGTYRSDYTYDNLYRLISANGEWHGNNDLYYETSMDYEANGRISRKVLYADTWLDGNYATENYDNRYYYANSSQPNTLSFINDAPQQSFGWDQKGNMVFHHNDHSGYDRKLCWDEQNRLLGVKDEGKLLSYYLYDANGDRTYKFTGEYTVQNQSGQWHYYYLLNSPTLYASPYLVTNKKGYTKHYYAESERIASRIGGGGLQDLHKGFETYPDMVSSHKESSANLFGKVMDCLDADALPQEDALKYLYEWLEFVEEEKDCYWYHPDHLGSASWITNIYGRTIQHLYYLPWGEDFVNQRTGSFSSMYTFSAKERDSETGLSYFGSRYYSSDLSIWLSVDPMASKYPSLSPYVYCADNPVKLVDPNGESISEFDENGNYLQTIKDNWWHNFWHGRTGRIVDGDGNVLQSFKFADPKNDVADLKKGTITKIHFVQESEIKKMLSKAGAFDKENKVSNNDLSNRYDYILRESPNNGKLDFALTGIPYQYSDYNQSLFLVDGVAHNRFNFGNFLWGAAGKALGLSLLELRSGAHYRALTQNGADGYPSQFDSSDDQFSIKKGVNYAKKHGYKDMYYRVVVGH